MDKTEHEATRAEREGFEIVEHTADVGLHAWGRDFARVCIEAARGLFALITDLDKIGSTLTREIALEAETREDLIHDWLEELNGLHQVNYELYGRFEVETDGRALKARVHGERMDPKKHELRLEIKAVTWHGLRLEESNDRIEAQILLDI